jgi:hypothetical protein
MHNRARNAVYFCQIRRYRLANDSRNTAVDIDFNKTITKKTRPKGPKLCSAKGMASLYFCLDNCVI